MSPFVLGHTLCYATLCVGCSSAAAVPGQHCLASAAVARSLQEQVPHRRQLAAAPAAAAATAPIAAGQLCAFAAAALQEAS